MADSVKKAIHTVSEVIFPGISASTLSLKNKTTPINYGSEAVSNLPLQMALYYNCWYSPFWLILNILAINLKYDYMSSLFKTVQIAVFITCVWIEFLRLYLGYSGNMCEKVTELAGCWLLSFLQIAIVSFLLFYDKLIVIPLEIAGNTILLLFVIFETLVGYIAVKKLARQQAIRFHIQHLKNPNE